jgi:hypothetical protein
MTRQLLGGYYENPGTDTTPKFKALFEGNLAERAGDGMAPDNIGDDFGSEDADAISSVLITLNRKIVNYGVGIPAVLYSQGRVTWGAGRGGAGNNQKTFDIAAGGTSLALGAANYLKVEVAHVAIGSVVPAVFDLSWVTNYGATLYPAYLTTRIGPVPAGGNSGIFKVPDYAATVTLSSDGAPSAADTITFFEDPAATFAFNRQGTAPAGGSLGNGAQVPAGAEFFTIQNSGATPQNYIAIWGLR